MAEHGNRTAEEVVEDITHGCQCPLSKNEGIRLATHLLNNRLEDNNVARTMIEFFNDKHPDKALNLPFEWTIHGEPRQGGILLVPNRRKLDVADG